MSDKKKSSAVKILVVDDDPSIGSLIAEFLLSEGYQPAICVHPKQALDYIEKESVGMAFVDINMPEINGIELASRIKDKISTCEVVFITGYGTFNNAIQAIKVGAYDYLRKPFGISELKLCMKRFQELQELKNRIRRVENRHYNLVQNIPSIVFIVREDLSLDFINRASEPMLGFTPEEAMNNPDWLKEIVHLEDLKRIEDAFSNVFQERHLRFSEECRLIHRDGHTIHAIIGSTALTESDQQERVEVVQGMIIDITDRVFLEKSVIQKEKLKILGAISAEVAHGIRNPLVSIGGFARRLKNRFSELPEGDIILSESKRLENMLQRIFDYLKPVEVNYRKCSINSLVMECIEQISCKTGTQDLPYRLNLDPSLEGIIADREILTSIFLSIIRNTQMESDSENELNIRTFETDNNCCVEFKKQGEGPKDYDLEPFFLPFNSSGSAFGLPLSYRLLKNMGGLVSYSKGEKETVFTVSIPKKPTPTDRMDEIVLQ